MTRRRRPMTIFENNFFPHWEYSPMIFYQTINAVCEALFGGEG
jgi:hypothetical protein